MLKTENPIANVRISPSAHTLLRKLAKEEDCSMQSILDTALEHYRREKFLRNANDEYEALKHKPGAWQKELEERVFLEQASADGLAVE